VNDRSAASGYGSRPRLHRGRLLFLAVLGLCGCDSVTAAPYVPVSDAQVIAQLPAGARHSSAATRDLTRARLDIALPLARF
jgi:hypothetical protein